MRRFPICGVFLALASAALAAEGPNPKETLEHFTNLLKIDTSNPPGNEIMGHTDVVGTQREKWTVDPFAAIRKDGYIYGRGTTDDKDNLVSCLMVMLALKRQNVPLDRDVIFLAAGVVSISLD